jgi:uncharacterized membrane protein
MWEKMISAKRWWIKKKKKKKKRREMIYSRCETPLFVIHWTTISLYISIFRHVPFFFTIESILLALGKMFISLSMGIRYKK